MKYYLLSRYNAINKLLATFVNYYDSYLFLGNCMSLSTA